MIEIGIGFLAIAVGSFAMAFRSRRKELLPSFDGNHAPEAEADIRYVTKFNDNVLQFKRRLK